MKLFVDDIRSAPDSTWLTVRTVTEAIRYISKFDFEEISLDHDISHYPVRAEDVTADTETYACEETFQPVAYYIAAKYWQKLPDGLLSTQLCPKITLHTANPNGAREMHHILRDVGIDSIIKPAIKDGPN